jgi:hypothetical protein
MFFYLLHNSTLIKKQNGIDKHISTMIYGCLIYILLHALLYASMDNKFFVSLRKYFWIIFVLDCISVSFTYIVNENGKVLFDQKLNFPEPTAKLPNIPNKIKNEDKIHEKKNIDKKPDKKLDAEKDKIKGDKIIKEDKKETTEKLKKSTSIRDLRNEEIERLALSNIDKEISDGDSELGSDIDLDAFEKSLNTEVPK